MFLYCRMREIALAGPTPTCTVYCACAQGTKQLHAPTCTFHRVTVVTTKEYAEVNELEKQESSGYTVEQVL
jgi:hypothetical protein